MEVKVNVINEMKRLRENTYSDRYTWIDEIVQNCQRAKATHIDVQIDYDRIIIADNGIGCTDPQILFDKSSSGWDADVTNSESPFGEGFFSTMMAANTITVSSVGFTAVFDVNRMFEENRTDVIDVQPNRKKSGFTVTLTDLCDNMYTWQVEKRFKEVGKYIKCPTMTVNGERVHYEGLNPDTENPFMRKVDTPYFKGWIEPRSYRNNDYGDNFIKCFAFSRHVKDSSKFYMVAGCLNFKENMITLRRPDRKEFIFDEKYDAMIDCLKDEIKKMYLKITKEGSNEDLYKFESEIKRYVSLDDYKKYIKFKFLTRKEVDMTDATVSTTADDDITNNVITANPAADDTPDQDSYYDGDVDSSPIDEIDSAPVATSGDFSIVQKASPQASSYALAAKTASRKRISNQTGEELTDDIQYAFYVKESEHEQYKEQIEIAQHYNIPVMEIRNELEREIVETDPRFNHISEMQSMVTISAEFTNASPANVQEVRASQILSRIARAFNASDNLFIICDTNFSKVLNVDGKDFVIEQIDSFATAYNGRIYINRSRLVAYKDLVFGSSDKLTPDDIKFILLNLETIAHEMSHALYDNEDGTMEHVSCINILMQKIINLIYGVKTEVYI